MVHRSFQPGPVLSFLHERCWLQDLYFKSFSCSSCGDSLKTPRTEADQPTCVQMTFEECIGSCSSCLSVTRYSAEGKSLSVPSPFQCWEAAGTTWAVNDVGNCQNEGQLYLDSWPPDWIDIRQLTPGLANILLWDLLHCSMSSDIAAQLPPS